jgi:hypothetical protein
VALPPMIVWSMRYSEGGGKSTGEARASGRAR